MRPRMHYIRHDAAILVVEDDRGRPISRLDVTWTTTILPSALAKLMADSWHRVEDDILRREREIILRELQRAPVVSKKLDAASEEE